MKGYVYCVSKYTNISPKIRETLQLINHWKECEHDFVYETFENITCIAYTNEPVQLNSNRNKYFFSYSGQLNASFSKVVKDIEEHNPLDAKNYIKNLSGAFSLAFAHKPTNTVRAYTHFARVNPVYYYEDDDCIVIGTDPLIVQVVAFQGSAPKIALEQSVSFLMNGYYTDNHTLFQGVKAISENTEAVIENSELTFRKIDDSIENMFMKKPTKEIYDELTHYYLKAYDILPESNIPHHIGLTGGKDSRLIALGLLEKKIPFKARTRGFEDHPDVIIAQDIARKLNINHTVSKPVINQANQIEVDLKEKILKTMIGTSGNVFGYENINYNPVYQNRIGLTGVGAECVRGGYGNHSKKNPVDISEELVKSFLPLSKYIINDKHQPYRGFLEKLAEGETSFKEAQCKHYIFYRVGRWAGGTRNSVLYTTDMYSPFFDNQFLKKATQLNINALIGEEVHYNIMERLNPDISKMPFFASRWGFEQRGPKDPNNYLQWLKRNPIYAKTQLGAYNWRMLTNPDPTLRNAMKEILLTDSKDEIYEVVDYKQIEQILEKSVNMFLNKFIWGLASIKLYKDYILEKTKKSGQLISINIPESNLKTLDNQPEIRDLTSVFSPINKTLKVQKEKLGTLFSRNKNEKGNVYIQTGGGPLAQPPINDLEILNINKRSQVRFRVCLEAFKPLDYHVYIMTFDDKKRIKSELLKVKYTKERMYIDKSIKLTKDAKYLKIAINFKAKEKYWNVKLKYAYIELK